MVARFAGGVLLLATDPHGNASEFSYDDRGELPSWGSVSKAVTVLISVYEQSLADKVEGCQFWFTVLRFRHDLKGPDLAGVGFHVLEAAKICSVKIAQESTAAVV